jgi:hypothetical protein
MWTFPDPDRRLRARAAAGRRSGLPDPDAAGLAWIWIYCGVWALFGLWLGAVYSGGGVFYQQRVWYLELWFGDHGAPATLQVSAMAVNVLMAVYLWLRFRGLRRRRRLRLAPYLVLAGAASVLLLQQHVYYQLSKVETLRLVRFPETCGVPIPDPTPETP